MKERLLKASEISCRVQQISEKGVTLLLYVTSRAAQNMLDDMYGKMGWQRHHKEIDGNLYCTIAVYDKATGQWIEREDVGTESNVEKEKGQASDSFKRACVNFGIGRELYSAPHIFVRSNQVKIWEKNGRYGTSDKFHVRSITYSANGEIDELEIVNQELETVYKQYPSGKITKPMLLTLNTMMEKAEVEGVKICDICQIKNLEDMDTSLFPVIMRKLERTIEEKSGQGV